MPKLSREGGSSSKLREPIAPPGLYAPCFRSSLHFGRKVSPSLGNAPVHICLSFWRTFSGSLLHSLTRLFCLRSSAFSRGALSGISGALLRVAHLLLSLLAHLRAAQRTRPSDKLGVAYAATPQPPLFALPQAFFRKLKSAPYPQLFMPRPRCFLSVANFLFNLGGPRHAFIVRRAPNFRFADAQDGLRCMGKSPITAGGSVVPVGLKRAMLGNHHYFKHVRVVSAKTFRQFLNCVSARKVMTPAALFVPGDAALQIDGLTYVGHPRLCVSDFVDNYFHPFELHRRSKHVYRETAQ